MPAGAPLAPAVVRESLGVPIPELPLILVVVPLGPEPAVSAEVVPELVPSVELVARELVVPGVPGLLLLMLDPVLAEPAIVASSVLRRDRQSALAGATAATSTSKAAEQLKRLMGCPFATLPLCFW
jgi:hypothetical protein